MSKRGYDYARARAAAVARAVLESDALAAHRIADDPSSVATLDATLVERALRAADRTFADYLDLVTGAKQAKHATASRVTREIRDRGLAAHCLDREHVGALARPMMRVRSRRGTAGPATHPGASRPDAMADRISRARAIAAHDITRAVAAWKATKGRDAKARKRLAGKIRAILHVWQDDAVVLDAARAAGWRV